jgi:transcription initiation factor TFIID subunit 12
MNNGQQGQQGVQPTGAQPNPQQQQQRKINIFRPEQMRNLPDQFSQEEKQKWEAGLKNLWMQVEKNGAETQAHLDAKRKLFDFSRTLTIKLQNARAQTQQGQQQAAASAARPASQGQPPQTQAGDGSAASNSTAQEQHPQPQQPPQQRAPPKVPQKLIDHVNSFPYVYPTTLTPGSQESHRWLTEMKNKYLKALTGMESASMRVTGLKEIFEKRTKEGKPFTPEEENEYKEKTEAAKKTHADCKTFVDNFRRQQELLRNSASGGQGNQGQQQGAAAAAAANVAGNANAPNAPNTTNAAPNAPTTGQAPPARPQMNVNQPANPALQNTQTVNAAIEAARNQQMGAGRPPMQQMNMPMSQAPQMGGQNVPANQNAGQPNIKTEAGATPQINTAVTQMQRGSLGGQGMQTASPQSAVPRSAGIPQTANGQQQGQIPQALSHTDALHQAARSYSNPAPTVMGHSHPNPSIPRDQNVITNKMPIPKHLPDRATAPPQPVTMPQARPSLSGGSNNLGNGVMNQPVIGNPPGNAPLSGNDEGILTSNKLNELVRQVTGGGNSLDGGQGLAPDVEQVRNFCFLCSIACITLCGEECLFFSSFFHLQHILPTAVNKSSYLYSRFLRIMLILYSLSFKSPITLLIKSFKLLARMLRNVVARSLRSVTFNSLSSVATISASLAILAMRSVLFVRSHLLLAGLPR